MCIKSINYKNVSLKSYKGNKIGMPYNLGITLN